MPTSRGLVTVDWDSIYSHRFQITDWNTQVTQIANTTGSTQTVTNPMWLNTVITAGANRMGWRGMKWQLVAQTLDPFSNWHDALDQGGSIPINDGFGTSWQIPWTMWCRVGQTGTLSATAPGSFQGIMFGDIDGAAPGTTAMIDFTAVRTTPVIIWGCGNANEGTGLLHRYHLYVAAGDSTAPADTGATAAAMAYNPDGGMNSSSVQTWFLILDYNPKKWIRGYVDGKLMCEYSNVTKLTSLYNTFNGVGAAGPVYGPSVIAGTGNNAADTNTSYFTCLGWRTYLSR